MFLFYRTPQYNRNMQVYCHVMNVLPDNMRLAKLLLLQPLSLLVNTTNTRAMSGKFPIVFLRVLISFYVLWSNYFTILVCLLQNCPSYCFLLLRKPKINNLCSSNQYVQSSDGWNYDLRIICWVDGVHRFLLSIIKIFALLHQYFWIWE